MDRVLMLARPATRAAWCMAVAVSCLAGLPIGCAPVDRTLEVAAPDALADARSVVGRYAAGDPLGSEMETYDDLVARVRQADPAKADALQAFFDANRTSPSGLKKRAEALLSDL
jgi:hypothetical protein